jgi:chromosome segregation ATPase
MGHGSQDAYGYSREVQDESYVASELSKLWKASIVVTSDQLEERDRQIQQLRKELNEIRATDIEQQIEAAESEIKSGLPNLLEDGEISEDEYKTRVADVQEEIRKLREELKNLKV